MFSNYFISLNGKTSVQKYPQKVSPDRALRKPKLSGLAEKMAGRKTYSASSGPWIRASRDGS